MATEGSSNLLLFNTSLVHMITLLKLSYMAWSDSPPSLKAKILLVILMVPLSYLQNLTLLLFRHQMTNTWRGGLLTNVSFVFFSSPTEESLAEIGGLSTAREVWLALDTAFNYWSKAREIHLKDELQLMKRGSRANP